MVNLTSLSPRQLFMAQPQQAVLLWCQPYHNRDARTESTPRNQTQQPATWYTNTVEIPQVRTSKYGLSSFRSGAARLWNKLPQRFREETNYNQFQSLIAGWNGESYHCSACASCQLVLSF